MNFLLKTKETVISVLPVMLIVIVLGTVAVPLEKIMLSRFIVGGIFLILGLTIFLTGVDLSIQPMGERCGAELTKKRSLSLLLICAFFIGFLVTVAEPDIQVFGDQVCSVLSYVNKTAFVFVIAFGVGFFIMTGLLRTVLHVSFKWIVFALYMLLFLIAIFVPQNFIGIAFDSGGATTGPLTVPFILALGLGVSSVRSNDNNSFGLTGITSVGPVMAVLVYSLFLRGGNSVAAGAETVAPETINLYGGVFTLFSEVFVSTLEESLLSIAPLIFLFVVFQIFLLKMTKRQVVRMVIGFVYSFVGLSIFLIGVNGGFMQAGKQLGVLLGEKAFQLGGFWFALLIFTGFLLGAVVLCAEPAVWVLTEQVESVSGGTIKRKVILAFLSIGAGIAIALAMWRAVSGLNLKFILVPGYALALLLMIFSPSLFTGIAFDSGGVASGPITSTFVLSFTLGAANCSGVSGDVFGVIALVAMTPLIAIQILGIIFNKKTKSSKIQTPKNQEEEV